jgi:diguanylate cyclase (GGDEF)-like protein
VLIVDDCIEDVRRVRELLHRSGEFVTHAARTVEEAQALLGDGSFDVALIDSVLWTDPSAALIQYLREHRNDVAVVLLTGGDNEREALPALKLGAHDFFNKAHLDDGQQLVLRIVGAFEENRNLRRRDTMVRWLEREARTDHLTGLHNRHAFDERLQEVCEKARADRRPVTLVLVDISGTRIVNEVHGHDVGDDLIRRTAAGISRCIRGSDFAARIGGDDFGVILADGDLALGRLIARRIAHELERLNSDEWADLVPVTVTFGMATGVNCDPGELFAAADQQLADHKSLRPVVSLFRGHEEPNGPSVA